MYGSSSGSDSSFFPSHNSLLCTGLWYYCAEGRDRRAWKRGYPRNEFICHDSPTYIRVSPENQSAVSKCNKAERGRGGRNPDRTRAIQGSISEDTLRRRVEDVGPETMQCTWNNVFYSSMRLLSFERKEGRRKMRESVKASFLSDSPGLTWALMQMDRKYSIIREMHLHKKKNLVNKRLCMP